MSRFPEGLTALFTHIDPNTVQVATIVVPEFDGVMDGIMPGATVRVPVAEGKGRWEGTQMAQIATEMPGDNGSRVETAVYRPLLQNEAAENGSDVAVLFEDHPGSDQSSIMVVPNRIGYWLPLNRYGTIIKMSEDGVV